MTRGERVSLVVIVVAAAVLRLAINDITAYSPADETVYVDLSQRLATRGFFTEYAAMARDWIANPRWWVYPNPLRCGYLALTTLAVQLHGSADPRALAWLSTIAGIFAVPLLFLVAHRIAGVRTALVASAFAAVSPIELAMGRRALQDELLCAAVLLAFAAIAAVLDDETQSNAKLLGAIAALTFALTIKETTIFLYPALIVFAFLFVRPARPGLRHAVLFAAPPLLWWGALTALTHDAGMLFRTIRIVGSAMVAPYVVQYQSGPPHRLLFDFLLVSPLVCILACAAVVALLFDAARDERTHALAAFVLLALAAFSLIASKNLRFIVMLDPFVRILAAWIVVQHVRTATMLAIVASNAVIELELFRAIFVRGAVYDPVTHTLLAALGAVPRDAASAPEPMVWPWVCALIAGIVWWSRVAVTGSTAPLHTRTH